MLARAIAAIGILLLLSGCLIGGPGSLVGDAESVAPLPDFTFYPYSEHDGNYVLSKDDPMPFHLAGTHYEASDGKMVVRLVPLHDETYIIAVTAEDGKAFFGTATIVDDVIALRIVLDSGLTPEVLKALGDIPPAIAVDLKPDSGGIEITRRATLDYAIEKLDAGLIPASLLVGWIGKSDRPPPTKIVTHDGRLVAAD